MSETAERKQAKLTQGPVGSQLARLTIPITIGIVSILFFNVVDTFWVSKLGTEYLAAMSFTFPVVFVIFGVGVGLGVGTTSVISKVIGERDHHKVQELTAHALILATLTVVSIAFIGHLSMDSLFRLLGAPENLIPLIGEYMSIWYSGVFLLIVPMSGNAVIRATGDTRTPGMVMMLSSLINAVLDPVLIFGYWGFPAMGMAGAAVATVCSWGFAFFIVLRVLVWREKLLAFELPNLAAMLRSWRRFLFIGLPAAGTQVLTPLSTGIMTALVATFGSQAVAGFGVGCRIEPIALVAVISLSSALNPFIGQNWGAGLKGRVDEAIRISLRFSLLLGLVVWPLLGFGAPYLARLFTEDQQAIDTLQWLLWIMPVSYGAEGVVMLACAAFNAFHKPMRATALNIIRLIGLYVPLAYLGAAWIGVNGVFVGGALANLISGGIGYFWIQRTAEEIGYQPAEA